MIISRILIITFLTCTYTLLSAQKCEDFDKSLFHMLPDNFPNNINCKDSLKRNQGWWINFTIKYNPIDKPDELAKGDYVESYSYGKYKDNIKVDEWITVSNVHLIYITRKDNYYYSKDTIIVTSGFENGGWNKSTLYFNSDSSIIKSTSLAPNDKFPICIECDKNGLINEECKMTYRNRIIKKFPFEKFESEFYGSFFMHTRDKILINQEFK
jgi:hypothetical protein